MAVSKKPLIEYEGARVKLNSVTEMPMASSFLWNAKLMIQANCRGFANAQFMQPEPAKYAHAPNSEAKHFMQPEQPFFAHHPGRFFYIKDLESGELFSAPYEPVRAAPDDFAFVAEPDRIMWRVLKNDIQVEIILGLTQHLSAELWQLKVKNLSSRTRTLSITPYFPVGYMSWMNHSGCYEESLQAVVCRSVTGYQKYPDYFKSIDFKDITYFLADQAPDSWDVRQSLFEGEGGLQSPCGLQKDQLSNSDSLFELPAAILQYKVALSAGDSKGYKFVFGPAKDEAEIAAVRDELLGKPDAFHQARSDYVDYLNHGSGVIKIQTPDSGLDNFVNHWLARQVFYLGDAHRLSTDPQTRNFLQDAMGMVYVKPELAMKAFLLALAQQNVDGSMPDGVLLNPNAELKYINQVPHMDHCVWLPICLRAYIDETNDLALLERQVAYADSDQQDTVREHIDKALHWLFGNRDQRGLSLIEQGDWNDPMNMVGYKGKGVSAWLTLATAYASNSWADVLERLDKSDKAAQFRRYASECNTAANTHFWKQDWYGRGITDDDVLFGIAEDQEGSIYLNPQSWAMLSGAADADRITSMLDVIEQRLETPFGVEILAPAYTKMRDDVGRLTQKHPGVSENGSVYNHAAAFYVYALYQIQDGDRAYKSLRRMIPGPTEQDLIQRGQMPTFIPNYYRGAYRQFRRPAGRSSQLVNTGTVSWVYRCLIEELFGLKGCSNGLSIAPQLPSGWDRASLTRRFRGATFDVRVERGVDEIMQIVVNDEVLEGMVFSDIVPGRTYNVHVLLPCE